MTRAVEEVLDEIGAEQPRLLVLAKADLLDADRRSELAVRHPGAVLVSAVTGEGLEDLVARLELEFARTLKRVELLLPYEEGGRLAELHELAGELDRTDTAEGVRVTARVPAQVAARFARFELTSERV
jgi:GTP-binding protein HflX